MGLQSLFLCIYLKMEAGMLFPKAGAETVQICLIWLKKKTDKDFKGHSAQELIRAVLVKWIRMQQQCLGASCEPQAGPGWAPSDRILDLVLTEPY